MSDVGVAVGINGATDVTLDDDEIRERRSGNLCREHHRRGREQARP